MGANTHYDYISLRRGGTNLTSSHPEAGRHTRSCINFSAFTLAEVLITLGIIGIVAVMTIPTIVQNYKKIVWDTSAEVFERKLEESLKSMNTQQTLAGHRNTAAFVNELSKHFKTNKICNNNDILSCFEDKIYWGTDKEEIDMSEITSAENFGQDDWGTEIIGTMFANGVTALIAYNPNCSQNPYSNRVDVMNCLAILYDTDGFRNPNTSSKDVRQNDNVASLGSSCYKKVNGVCFLNDAFDPPAISFSECEKTKDDYDIESCCDTCDANGGDSYFGAVKTCKDIGGRLPTMGEVQSLARYLPELGFNVMSGLAPVWYEASSSNSKQVSSALCNITNGTCSIYGTNRFGSPWSICVKD